MMTTKATDRNGAALALAQESVAARAAALDEMRTDVRPDLAGLGRAGLFDAALEEGGLPSLVHVIDTIAAQSLAVSCTSSSRMSHAHTLAPRCANARLIARPNPCAAPVTIAVLPPKSRFTPVYSGSAHEPVNNARVSSTATCQSASISSSDR